jgi:oxygen-dependent protoporphyrinogen oxidase
LSAVRHATFTRAVNHLDEQDLDSWGRRHVGDGAVEYLLSPFVQGIYGVRPADLGVVAAFPELSLTPGSTLLGTMLGKAFKRRPAEGNASTKKGEPKQRKRMVAPLRGMGNVTERLQQRLLESLGERFRRGETVTEIPDAPNVVLATPAYVTARLLGARAPQLSAALEEVRYTPIVSVTAFVPTNMFTRPVKGVGVLVPPREGRKSLGVLFNSSAFAGRVFDESRYASFTLLFGGTSQPGWVDATDEEIGRAVSEELGGLLGIKGEPAELVINRWRRAIPQYSTALPSVWRTARESWCAEPGRILFGNYTGQVSLRGMIETAAEMG